MKAPNIKLCTSVKCEGNHVLHGVGQSLGVLDKGGASKRTKVAMNTLYWKDMGHQLLLLDSDERFMQFLNLIMGHVENSTNEKYLEKKKL